MMNIATITLKSPSYRRFGRIAANWIKPAMTAMSGRMRFLKSLSIAGSLLMLTACATTLSSNVDSVSDNRIDSFQTYAWLDGGLSQSSLHAPEVVNPVNGERIRRAIDQQLTDKGYRQVDLADADFVVSAAIGANDEFRVRSFTNSVGLSSRGRFSRRGFGRRVGFANRAGFGRGLGGVSSRIDVQEYTEGVLVLNVFETESQEAIWHGSASKRLSKNFMAPELIDEAVTTLLEQFPGQSVPAVRSKATTTEKAGTEIMS